MFENGKNENPEKCKQHHLNWIANSPDSYYTSQKKSRDKRRNTVSGKLNNNISNCIRLALKGNKKGRSWESLVGYTLSELKEHLELHFQSGITWDNYGKGNCKWEIDHIIPQSYFNITSSDCKDFKICWFLLNLQPMWGDDNRKKSNKITYR
jgi:hypothetical protein